MIFKEIDNIRDVGVICHYLGSIIDIMSINARKLSHRFFQLVLAPSYSCSCHVQCANI